MSKSVTNNILLAGEIAATIATVYIAWKVIAGPDASKTVTMRLTKHGETFCMRQASAWAQLADTCQGIYDRTRSVSV